ncbi:hypothetical protein [Nocardia terpenica]|uniref:Uncharacterized protein n=1 Tax=Nocardia terpenica TaxID=455432 RepID=A0A164HI92_9NOCA|nr:hypothetical protein [Nocardia terpenica]KZM68537.1 hypothetical protein AWN90_11765 [Nocardia terpenica]NQE88505.1 hypothetical protein [Nocardia terpenica]
MELTREQLARGLDQARRAAREAQQTLTLTLTKKKQYRRYRATAGDAYLDWPRWKQAYLDEYNRRIKLPSPPMGQMGGFSGGMSGP